MRTDFIPLSKGQIDTQIMFASHKIPYDSGSNTNYFSFFPHLSHIPVGATTFSYLDIGISLIVTHRP